MLNNCTGLKNFDEKQDFVKKKYVVFCLKNTPKRKNASKRKMQIIQQKYGAPFGS